MSQVRTTMRKLNAKEMLVARYVSEGHSNRSIAQELNCSPSYVKNVLWLIYIKLGLTQSCHRAALAVWYVQNRKADN